MPVATLEPAVVPRVRFVDSFRRVLGELEGIDVDMERVNINVAEVEAHGLAHGRAELLVVGFQEREFRSRWHGSVVRNSKKEFWRSDVKRQVLCHVLVAQVDEVCPKHEADTRGQPHSKSFGPTGFESVGRSQHGRLTSKTGRSHCGRAVGDGSALI